MRYGIFAFLGVLAMVQATTAAAQTQTTPLWSAGGTVGFGQTWDDEGAIGRGLLLSGHVERRFTRGMSFECGVEWLAHNRGGEGMFQADGHTTMLTAALKYSWTGKSATSYVLGGLVLAHHTGTAGFEDDMRTDHTTMPGVSVGGGVLFTVSNGWRVGPEGRLLLLSPGNEAAPALGMYAGVRVSLPIGGHN
jgi:hypothetical protein